MLWSTAGTAAALRTCCLATARWVHSHALQFWYQLDSRAIINSFELLAVLWNILQLLHLLFLVGGCCFLRRSLFCSCALRVYFDVSRSQSTLLVYVEDDAFVNFTDAERWSEEVAMLCSCACCVCHLLCCVCHAVFASGAASSVAEQFETFAVCT